MLGWALLFLLITVYNIIDLVLKEWGDDDEESEE